MKNLRPCRTLALAVLPVWVLGQPVPETVPDPVPTTEARELPVPETTPGPEAASGEDGGFRVVPIGESTDPAADLPHTFNFLNSPLEPVFEMFTELTGKMVLYSPELTGTVNLISGSVELTRTEAIEAITSSLSLSGIILMPMGERFVKAVSREEAIQHATRINSVNPDKLPESGEYITRTVQLDQILPSEAVKILTPLTNNPDGLVAIDSSKTLLIHSDASTMKQLLSVLQQTDVVPEYDYSLEVIPIKYSKVDDLYDTMDSLITGEVQTGTTNPATGTGVGIVPPGVGQNVFGGAYGGINRGGSYGSRYGGYGGGGAGYRPYQTTRTATSTPSASRSSSTSFSDNLRRVISRAAEEEEVELLSEARIVPDQRSNSLLIFANRHDLNIITNMVSKVDQLLAQVLIEAIVLEINLGDELNYGVSMGQKPETYGRWKSGGTLSNPVSGTLANPLGSADTFLSGESINNADGIAPGGFNYFASYNDSLQVALSAIATDTSLRIISRPRIQTSHAVQGIFRLGERIPYASGSTSSGLSSYASSYVEHLQIGVNIAVTPYITPEGYIVMDILQVANSRGEDVIINGNPTPSENERVAQATLSVRDGDTIMLGGFIRQSKTKSRAGVPILKDIPLLGNLFRNRNNRTQRSELIILLRATVLETPEEAALVARIERESTSGIREMEEDFEAERRSREEERKGPGRIFRKR